MPRMLRVGQDLMQGHFAAALYLARDASQREQRATALVVAGMDARDSRAPNWSN
jgi:hypothetical protein